MTELELLKRLRWTLNDEGGVVWQDDFLLRALRRAAVEYFRRVPLLYGWTPVMPDEDNVYRWPPDFAAYFYGINHYCEEILPATPRRVSRYPELYDEDKRTYHPPDSDSNKWIEYDGDPEGDVVGELHGFPGFKDPNNLYRWKCICDWDTPLFDSGRALKDVYTDHDGHTFTCKHDKVDGHVEYEMDPYTGAVTTTEITGGYAAKGYRPGQFSEQSLPLIEDHSSSEIVSDTEKGGDGGFKIFLSGFIGKKGPIRVPDMSITYLFPGDDDLLKYYDPRGARTRFVVDHGNHTYTPYPDAYGTRRVRYLLTEPEEGVFQNFTATEGEELPEQAAAADSEFGVVAEMDFGKQGDKEVFVEPEFGTLRVLAKGICSGNLKYVRCDIENWELADPRGVVHYAAHIAFQQENDRKNPELSDLHLQLFNKFVALNTNHKVRAVRTQPAGVFF